MAEYITNEGVLCKGCGKLLVRYEDGIGYATPDYAEMEIEFADGGKHLTPMCMGCVDDATLNLVSIYQDDVDRWDKELKQAKMKKTDKFIRDKVPVKASRFIHKEDKEDKMKNRKRGSIRK